MGPDPALRRQPYPGPVGTFCGPWQLYGAAASAGVFPGRFALSNDRVGPDRVRRILKTTSGSEAAFPVGPSVS